MRYAMRGIYENIKKNDICKIEAVGRKAGRSESNNNKLIHTGYSQNGFLHIHYPLILELMTSFVIPSGSRISLTRSTLYKLFRQHAAAILHVLDPFRN